MTDLKEMMDSVSLDKCRSELKQQFHDIAKHDNKMKRAVLLCFIGEIVMEEISHENQNEFIDELKAYCTKVKDEFLSEKNILDNHLEENYIIMNNINRCSDELKGTYNNIKTLLDDYDKRLTEVIRERDKAPIGEL
jgi:hypothetical protein